MNKLKAQPFLVLMLFTLGPLLTLVRYDTWLGTMVSRSVMIFPRKNFIVIMVFSKSYAAEGDLRKNEVEE